MSRPLFDMKIIDGLTRYLGSPHASYSYEIAFHNILGQDVILSVSSEAGER
jgi:hypothetical protein